MKKGFRLTTISAFCMMASMAHAGIPVWTFTPLTGTSGTIPANE